MVRHGYANCVMCHHSPSGGGILTDYGRALSREALSTAGAEGEGDFLYGVVKPPKPLDLGGDVRLLQLYQSMATRRTYRFIPMQADLEAALAFEPVTIVGTAGVDNDGNFISRRHYVVGRPTRSLSVRGGRFMPAFGINTENHSIGVRRGIGRDEGTETYNVEAAWIDKSFDAFLTGIFGRPDNQQLGAETGGAASASIFLGQSFKVGASYYYGSRDVAERHVAGPFAILGFSPHVFVLAELDFQWLRPKIASATQSGFVDDVRLDFEVYKGVHLYLLQELSMLDTSNKKSLADSYGFGVQLFPRPHLELNLLYQRQRIGGTDADFGDFAFGMFHFYL